MNTPYKGWGAPFTTPDPTIGEFKRSFDRLADEITTGDGTKVMSHSLDTQVRVRCINSEKSFSVVGLDLAQLMGCGCPCGIVIEIAEDDTP